MVRAAGRGGLLTKSQKRWWCGEEPSFISSSVGGDGRWGDISITVGICAADWLTVRCTED